MAEKKGGHHRGRRKRKKKQSVVGRVISTIVLIAALAVFFYSGFQLYTILKGYYDGRSEYDKVREVAIDQKSDTSENGDGSDGFSVNFDELKAINEDTIGWIRFSPKPEEINYPIVQGRDNDEYLHRTFSANENTLGAIFLNVDNKADFSDRNSVIYGHRMKDGSMFRHLQDYDGQEFWKSNPYFYIYTPDGKKLTYHIFAAGEVEDTSDIYQTQFESDDAFLKYLNTATGISLYDTGVNVDTGDTIVTLSTCTSANDEHRFVVLGVKESEESVNQ